MRTTLDIPEPLLEEARRLLGFKAKTDTVPKLKREKKPSATRTTKAWDDRFSTGFVVVQAPRCASISRTARPVAREPRGSSTL